MSLPDPGKRLIARIIDFGILIVLWILVNIVFVVAVLADTTTSGNSFEIGVNGVSFLISIGFWVLYWLYESLMASSRGQTIGKMIMKIKIVDLEGGQVTTGTGMKRSLVWLVPLVPCCIGFIGFLVIEIWGLVNLFNRPDRMTLMDQFADTTVVDA